MPRYIIIYYISPKSLASYVLIVIILPKLDVCRRQEEHAHLAGNVKQKSGKDPVKIRVEQMFNVC